MGLDMYLDKRTYVKHWEHKGDDNYEVTVTKHNTLVSTINPKRVKWVIEEVGYWRKANHIHKWFVDNVQDGVDDCGEYCVSDKKLKELLEVCKTVLEDNSKASELLPTQSGFFFGATQYDEYYIRDIQDTVKILEDLFTEYDEYGYLGGDIYYQSSW
jgi:hypothetical protein